MSKKEKILIFTLAFLMVFSVGTMIVVKTVDYVSKGAEDLESFTLVIIARFFTIFGFLFIIGWAFFRGYFKDIEKPKTDILELHEKIEKKEKEKLKTDIALPKNR